MAWSSKVLTEARDGMVVVGVGRGEGHRRRGLQRRPPGGVNETNLTSQGEKIDDEEHRGEIDGVEGDGELIRVWEAAISSASGRRRLQRRRNQICRFGCN
ncbi:hypothetical protein LINGRAHAP2_LOCUS3985 [Linum grandiflorum]